MNRATLRTLLVGIAACTVFVAAASTAQACPSCQQALGSAGGQGDLARGIYYSVLFMMATPFAIVGTFAGFAYRAVKREQRRQNEAAQTPREEA